MERPSPDLRARLELAAALLAVPVALAGAWIALTSYSGELTSDETGVVTRVSALSASWSPQLVLWLTLAALLFLAAAVGAYLDTARGSERGRRMLFATAVILAVIAVLGIQTLTAFIGAGILLVILAAGLAHDRSRPRAAQE